MIARQPSVTCVPGSEEDDEDNDGLDFCHQHALLEQMEKTQSTCSSSGLSSGYGIVTEVKEMRLAASGRVSGRKDAEKDYDNYSVLMDGSGEPWIAGCGNISGTDSSGAEVVVSSEGEESTDEIGSSSVTLGLASVPLGLTLTRCTAASASMGHTRHEGYTNASHAHTMHCCIRFHGAYT